MKTAKRDFPLFVIDTSRSHGRARETDFVSCTSPELPFVAEVTLLDESELVIDQDWTSKSKLCVYSEPRAGIRAKLKIAHTPVMIDNSNIGDLRSLMRRALKEWIIRRNTVAVDLEDISNEAIVKFCDTLLEQTRENLRENPKDHQAYMVACILNKIKTDYTK